MSLHPSLRIDSAGQQKRTVMTRLERIKDLMKRGLWKDGQSVHGLPKVKIVRLKTRRKVKEEAKEGAAAPAAAGKDAAKAAAPKAAAPKAAAPKAAAPKK